MRSVWAWQHIVRRRFFLFYWPLLLAIGLIVGGLALSNHQRLAYLANYQASVEKNELTVRANFDGLDDQSQPTRAQYAGEAKLAQGSADRYLVAYVANLTAWKAGTRLATTGDGAPVPAVQVPTAISATLGAIPPASQATNANEYDATITELTRVHDEHLQPMMPARLLTTEATATHLAGRTASEKRTALERAGTRFYEYGWYYLEHLVTQDAGLLLVAVVLVMTSFGYGYRRAPRTGQNTLVQLGGGLPLTQFFGALGWTWGVMALSLAAVLGGGLLGSYLVNGPGSAAYPLLRWQTLHTVTFVPLWQMLGQEGALLLLTLVFLAAVVWVLQALLNRHLLALGGGLAVLALGLFVPSAWWSPLAYLHVHEIANGYTNAVVNQADLFATQATGVPLTPLTGCLVLLGWTVLLVLLGWLIQARRVLGPREARA